MKDYRSPTLEEMKYLIEPPYVYKQPSYEMEIPKNDKGIEYDIITELYAPNSFGNYIRFTTLEGLKVPENYKDWILDNMTGDKWKIDK